MNITLYVLLYRHLKEFLISSITAYRPSIYYISSSVINWLDPIEELYDMYSEEEDAPRIVEVEDDGLDFLSDVDGPADPYMDL